MILLTIFNKNKDKESEETSTVVYQRLYIIQLTVRIEASITFIAEDNAEKNIATDPLPKNR